MAENPSRLMGGRSLTFTVTFFSTSHHLPNSRSVLPSLMRAPD
jgi:hypothetical protein